MKKFAIAIHGGAGTILKKNMTPELEEAYHNKLKESLVAGFDILKKGGTSLDAVEIAIQILEDSPLFNAGKGSVFNALGEHEMDAGIMDGKSLKAGAVAGLKTVRNPISAARLVMEKTSHVLMVGEGAEHLAKEHFLNCEQPQYFFEQHRWEQWQKIKGTSEQALDHSNFNDKKYGTVGAVAIDVHGNLCAGSSTGGLTNKRPGRVGDSPVIGAGTYANNKTCAVAGTGEGEYFMRNVIAYDVSALMEYKGLSLEQATEEVIMHKLVALGGKGGLIAVDDQANISLVFNTRGMYRGAVTQDGIFKTDIYK
ncbi:MAG: isoaspartyl peptidase/L-asparaginase [Cytophagales bacterium]